jgi:hypothetical protein
MYIGSYSIMQDNGYTSCMHDMLLLRHDVIVDTSATSTKQFEAITHVAIRVMRLKRDG